jgi:multidrug resistance efflux pump
MQEHSETSSTQSTTVAVDAVWQALVKANTAEQLTQAWLEVLCSQIPNTRAGLLLLEETDGSFSPVAVWPSRSDLSHLVQVAQDSLVDRKGTIKQEAGSTPRFAYPLISGEHLYGTVVVELRIANDKAMMDAMRLTHWGVGWLINLFNQQQLQQDRTQLDNSAFLFDIVLSELGDSDYQQASLAVVNKLAEHFACHQVLLGLEKGKSIDVLALSHSAWFEKKTQRIHLAAQAMNEAFDQHTCVIWPEQDTGSLLMTDAHRRYANETGSLYICSLPLEVGIKVIGVILLERDTAFSVNELAFLETLSLSLAPVLALKQDREESLLKHACRVWHHGLKTLTDTSHPGIKLVVVTAFIIVLVTALMPADFRVSSPAVVEGAIVRAAVAPFEGYIREAPVRAGDIVKQGQLLVKLEDKDLVLEKIRWESELEVAVRKEREAMSKADRVTQRQAAAQANQARAQLNLTLERLNRLAVTAPFDAIVVKGDLSQKLGSPVQQGDVQFELAPLDAWRVILKVDERDIAYIQENQTGELILSSLPGRIWPFKVNKVTPVAVAEEGRNYFRVEAKLAEDALELKPNMEGIGKIAAGDQPLLWIWTHRLIDWLRMACWEWLP